MVTALKQIVTVQPGGRVELTSAELKPGAQAEVIVLVDQQAKPEAPNLMGLGARNPFAILLNVPKGGCFKSAAEIDAFIRSERDAWDC
ncbi:MAG: hypothetical protein ABSE73_08040 [Planctomycetota bacterium]